MKKNYPILVLSLIALLPLGLSAQITSPANPQTNTQQQLSTTDPIELTTGLGYDFTAQPTIFSISAITVTLTLQDGNSGNGDFDFNHLFLALDGINTGIALNGFLGNGLQTTLTISGSISPATSAALLAQFADKRFVGSIVTDNANDTALQPNDIFVGNDTNNATTTLTLVPEPATLALIGTGLLLILGSQVRRFRRNV
jgi:hypothetical protein